MVQPLQVQVKLGQLGGQVAPYRSQGEAEAAGQEVGEVLGLQLEEHIERLGGHPGGVSGRAVRHRVNHCEEYGLCAAQ